LAYICRLLKIGVAKKITLKDISQKTGFTINTVSHALKDKPDISIKTKEMICEAANRMGYIPNKIARSLRNGKTKTIAVIMPDISDPLIAMWVKDIEYRLKDYGYSTIIINTDEEYEKEEQSIILALSTNVDGIILCPTQKSHVDMDILKNRAIPFVLLGRRFNNDELDYIVSDDVKGGYLATKHLLSKGHKEILFLNGPLYISSAKERFLGYQEAFKSENILFNPNLVKEIKVTAGNASRILEEIVDEKTKFTSIFAFSDLIAWEVISFLQKINIKVPDDVAVVGYDNIQSRFFFPYPLTTVNYSKRNMAIKAVDTLLNIIDNPKERIAVHIFEETKLVIRESS
jgi:LacI family transcriptional regulator